MSKPRTFPSPDVSCISPRIVFKNVDLPAPFGPSNPVEPFSILTSHESRATWVPYALVRAVDSIINSLSMIQSPHIGPLNMTLVGASLSYFNSYALLEALKFFGR